MNQPAAFSGLVLCLALFTLSGPASAETEVVINAGRGDLRVFLPDRPVSEPVPLLLALHGYGSSGEETESFLRWQDEVDSRGFAYSFPNGNIDLTGRRFWDATDACCDFLGLGPGDPQYLLAILREVRQVRLVSHLVLFGISNGGFMSYRMACEEAEEVRAIASMAGANFDDLADCRPSRSVRTAQIHGTEDETILYGGGFTDSRYPGAADSASTMARRNGCSLPPVRVLSDERWNFDFDVAGQETRVEVFEGCAPAGAVELWTMEGTDHVPNLTPEGETRILDFLFRSPASAGVPTAPTGFRVDVLGGDSLQLSWVDTSPDETGFVIERRQPNGTFLAIAEAGPNATAIVLGNLTIGETYTLRVRARNAQGLSDPSGQASATLVGLGLPCVEDAETLCLNDGRFELRATFRTADDVTGEAQAQALTADTGFFWFFRSDNLEVVVKVLNGCGVNNRFWVFIAGLTNVEVQLTVRDVQSQAVKVYSNALGSAFLPIQDVDAFNSCGV